MITRTVAEPQGVFAIVSEHLKTDLKYKDISRFVADNFFFIRRECENFVRRNYLKTLKKREVSIYDIYDCMKCNYGLSEESVQAILSLEIEIEKQTLKPISSNIEYLKGLLSKNERVVLISDMYFPENILRSILVDIDKVFENIKIYVSCEYNCSKYDGDLYKCVKNEEDVEYSDWNHYGDNKFSDVVIAKSNKISAKLYDYEQLFDYEKAALNSNENSCDFLSVVGVAKYTRLLNSDRNDVYNFACSFAGPILYGYVDWVISQALELNVDTLYFIARDGFVLKEIADVVISYRKLELKTRYIYGSRKAWRIPQKDNINDFIRWVFEEFPKRISLPFVAQSLNIDVKILNEYLPSYSTSLIKKSSKRNEFLERLLKDEKLKSKIVAENSERRNNLLGYLKQEIETDCDKLMFIDLHGSGRTQDILTSLLKEINPKIKTVNCYFHTNTSVIQSLDAIKKAYITSFDYVHYSIELLGRNPDGQTLGYKKVDDEFQPVLENVDSSVLYHWGYNFYLKGLRDYTFNLEEFLNANKITINSYSVYVKYFEYLHNNFDYTIGNILGDIPYMETGAEKNSSVCAKKLSIFDLITYFFSGKLKLELAFLSIARSGDLAVWVHRFVKKYGSFRKFLVNVYYNKKKDLKYIQLLGKKFDL